MNEQKCFIIQPLDDERREEILERNPKVSRLVVEQYRELEKKLEELGVDTKPHYTLSPPFGGAVSNLSNK